MSHYFTDNRLPQNRKEISFFFRFSGFIIPLITDNGVFSKAKVDFGSVVLLKTIKEEPLGEHILDLGCGYGVIGITVKKCFSGSRGVDGGCQSPGESSWLFLMRRRTAWRLKSGCRIF